MYKTGFYSIMYKIHMNKWEMFANDIFAKVTSFAKFAKILSCEYFQVHSSHTVLCMYIDREATLHL